MTLYRPKDSNFYWVNITHPITNKRIRKSTKTSTKKDALLFEADLIKKLTANKDYLLHKNQNKTFIDLKDQWLKEKSHKKSINEDISKLRKLEKHFGNYSLQELTSHEVKIFLDNIARNLTGATANRYRALLLAMLNKASKEWNWINKAPYVPRYQEPKLRIRYLTKEEADRLLDELPEHLRNMAIFSLQTGLRQSNVKNLRWKQINWDTRTVVFHPNEVKSGKYLNIPLSETAFQLLINIYEQQDHRSDYVFTYKDKPITQVSTKAWRKALTRANIHDFRWHNLRHTWAS